MLAYFSHVFAPFLCRFYSIFAPFSASPGQHRQHRRLVLFAAPFCVLCSPHAPLLTAPQNRPKKGTKKGASKPPASGIKLRALPPPFQLTQN